MILLTNEQKKKLKGLAHSLKPVIQIGQKGITESLVKAVHCALDDHELIKMKFIDYKDQKNELVNEIIGQTGSSLVQIIGNVAILYRQGRDVSKRLIKL